MYLTIITTVLVATQVIRITQNTISLIHNNRVFKAQLQELADRNITADDFDTQRKAYQLIVDYLESKVESNGEDE